MPQDIAALVGSRICHDLISPIGAIGNGVELLSLTDGDSAAEMALINESVENANARIRYFRIAYGAASNDQVVSRNEILSILSAVARGGRFTYFWQVEGDQPRADVRAAFLMMQCLEASMPFGGDISATLSNGEWTLSSRSDRLQVDSALWSSLSEPNSGYVHTSAQVQFALLPDVLADIGRRLRITLSDQAIRACF